MFGGLKRVFKNVHQVFFFGTPPILVKPFGCDPSNNIFAMFSPCLSIIGSCDTKIQLKKILNNNCSFTVVQKYPAKPKPMKLLPFFLRIKFRLAMHICTLYHLLNQSSQAKNYCFCSILNTFISLCRC